jgi:4-hydroxythreonine-4-phosphate dehydrogenase
MKAKIVVTCGDPAGVGPEVIADWAASHTQLANDVLLVGPRSWFEDSLTLEVFRRVEVGASGFRAQAGTPSEEGARIALEALEYAAEACRRGEATAAVTGPVSKLWLQRVGFPYAGQTEFFAARWGGKPVMAFGGGRLRVVLATWHIPLAAVPQALDAATLERAIVAAAELGRLSEAPQVRIGVCGLNPHAGEEGLLGTEERDWIDPLLDRLRARIPGLSRALPADTLFWRALQGEFDVVVALYHDQGLAPLKAIAFEDSVNITLGLPYLRMSPDHGTAFDIAGAGRASSRSFTRAMELALAAVSVI